MTETQIERAARLWIAGMDSVAIAKSLHVSEAAVWLCLENIRRRAPRMLRRWPA